MKRIFGFLIGILGLAPAAWGQTPKMTLEECYRQALGYSEEVAISQEEINRAKARFNEALGRILPRMNFEISEFLQDSSVPVIDGSGGVVQTFNRSSTPELRLNLIQPLFHGLQEIQSIKLAKVDRQRQELLQKNVERLLFEDVAVAFLTIALVEREIQTTEKIIAVSRAQVTDLKKRIDLGKSRESEGTSQLADLSLLEADLERQRGDRKVAYDILSFLTGLDPQPEILIRDGIIISPKPLEDYLASAQTRYDVQASQKTAELAKGDVKIRQGDLLPRAEVEANFYPLRVGFQSQIDWDAEIRATIPLFDGAVIGRIQEAKATSRQADFQAEQQRRIAVDETRRNYDAWESSRRQFIKFQRAADISAKSYSQQSRDFQLGLLDNFDLLQTQRTWFTALRQRDVAEAQVWTDWFRLQVSAGVLP
jgi:outer membrane protein TolC